MALESSLRRTQTRQIAYAVVLSALAIALSPLSIPLGVAKVFPGQHFINVIAAVLVGPWWGLAIAFVTSLARNLLGIGTPLAFPGSMVGVVLAGLAFRATGRVWLAVLGELIGSAVIGATVGALVVAPLVMHKSMAMLTLILAFLPSVALGAVLGWFGVRALRRAGWLAE